MKNFILIIGIALLSLNLQAQNSCLEFDGTNDYVSSAANPNLNMYNSSFTIEFWIYADASYTYSGERMIIECGNGWAAGTYLINSNDDNNLRVVFEGRSSAEGAAVYDFDWTDGKWHHIAGVLNTVDHTLKLYIDGVVVSSVEENNAPGNVNVPMYLASRLGTGYYSQIKMDEVRIWNDARTEAEIRQNMYRELPDPGSEANLKAYYKLNETSGTTATDSKNSYNGTLGNFDSQTGYWQTSPAMFGPKNCLDFDGSSDYVSIPSDASLATSQFTVEFWVYYDGQPSGYNGIIDKGRDIGGGNGNDWWFITSPGESGIFGYDGTEFWFDVSYNTWTHIAGIYDGSQLLLYVNGIQKNAINKTYTPQTQQIIIGRRTAGIGYFNGKLDEVRIWSDAKTDEEIRDNMCKNISGNESNLVAYYNFDNASGDKLQDFSGNGNDGTLTSMDNSNWITSSAFNTWLNTSSTTWAEAYNWSNGIPSSGSNVSIYNYTNEPDIPASQTFGCLYLGSGISTNLTADMTVNSSFILNKNLDLNGQTITLGSSGYLIEDAGVLNGSTGSITTTRSLSDIEENVAGLGAEITTSADMGSTTITRTHAAASSPTSIERRYQISPTTNTGLDATLVFHYDDTELNGNTEADLKLYRSTNGNNWDKQNASTVNTTNNTLTLTGMNSFSYWTASDASSYTEYAPNNCLVFDGTDDYVSCGSINLSGGALTLECWIYVDQFKGGTDISSIMGTEESGSSAFLRFGDGGWTDDKVQFVLDIGGQTKLNGNTALLEDTWYHIAGVYDGSEMKIYINGILDASKSQSGNFISNNLFNMANNSGRYLNGIMDEVRIWNDARAETEIRQNMYRELPDPGSEGNLVAYYKLNSVSGTLTSDSKGSYSGTLTNFESQSGYWQTSPAFFGPKKCVSLGGNASSSNRRYAYLNHAGVSENDNFTMMAWVYALDLSTPTSFVCVVYDGTAGYAGYGHGFGFDGDELKGFTGKDDTYLPTGETISEDRWYHVAMRRSSGVTQFFLDGRLLDYSSTTNLWYPNGNFSVGNAIIQGSYPNAYFDYSFDGYIDDVCVFDAALSDQQIREYMCKSFNGNEDNLEVYYNFDNVGASKLQSFDGGSSIIHDLNFMNIDENDWADSRAYNTWLNTADEYWDEATNWSLGEYPADYDNDMSLVHSVGIYNYEGGVQPYWNEDAYVYNFVVGENATILTDAYSLYAYANIIVNNDFNIYECYLNLDNENCYLIEDGGVLYANYTGETSEIYVNGVDLNSPSAVNVCNLGVIITTEETIPGLDIDVDYGDIFKPMPIIRHYYIDHGTANDLNATVVFSYYDSELKGQLESLLKLYHSTDKDNLSEYGSYSHNSTDNTFTATDVDDLNGYWVISDGFNMVGNALDFDGTNDYVSCGSINLSGDALTLECWIYVDQFKGGNDISSIMGTEESGSSAFLRFGDGGWSDDKVQFVLDIGGQTKLNGNTALLEDTWYHIAGVYDGSEMKIYINGVLDASKSQNGSFNSNNLFNIANNSGRYLNGKMDEVRVWSDARTQTEIRQNMCNSLIGNEDNLELYYNFNVASGTTLYNVTGSGNNGTLTNDPSWVASNAFYIWLGTDSNWPDYDWDLAANWTYSSPPGENSNVGLPFETYRGLEMMTSRTLNNLVVSGEGEYDIKGGAGLTVSNLYNYYYGYGDFYIYSSGKTADEMGSLIVTGESDGNIRIGRYVDVAAKGDKWHYVSSPVSEQSINNTWMDDNRIKSTPTYQFFRYDEPTNYWIIYGSTGNPVAFNDSEFVEAKGYCLSRSFSGPLGFEGSLRTSDVTYSATYNTDGGYGNNLVGNPYPSFLNATSTAHATNNFLTVNTALLDDDYEAMYIWDETSGYDGSNQDYKVISNASVSGYSTIDQHVIAPGQAFFVKVVSPGGDLQFNENMQTHTSGDYYKDEKETWPSLELKVKNNAYVNYTLVAFNQDMTKGLDPSYDAGKMKGNPYLALYTKLVNDNGNDFAVQALPYFQEDYSIPVGIDVAQTGGYTFEVAKMDQIPEKIQVYFEDKENGISINMKESNSYSCEINETGKITDRFVLHFKEVTGIDDITEDANINIWQQGDQIILQGDTEIKRITLTDITGRTLGVWEHTETIPAPKTAGVYLVTLASGNQMLTKKIIIE